MSELQPELNRLEIEHNFKLQVLKMAEFRNMSEPEKNQGINYFKELDILRAMADELIYTLYGQKPISKNDRKKIISKILDEAQKDKPELKSKIEELKIKGILDLNMESY